MYIDFYGFREKPFNLTPDPRFIFLSKNHREAFAHLLYGIKSRAGFILLTGEVGSGKTTVIRSLLTQLDPDHYRTALIFNPYLSPTELIHNINREFAVQTDASVSLSLLDSLNSFLLQQNSEGRTVVLVIDEAQNLEAAVLEQIRLISNLETDRDKLIQIVLSGQPELTQILKKKEMRQLSQRITVRHHLQPMDFEDAVAYVNHRVKVAGRRDGVLFSKRALRHIYSYSRGLPRLINAACDRVLLAGYSKDAAKISSGIAGTGIKDMKEDSASSRKWPFILIPIFAILVVLVAAGIYFRGDDFIRQFIESRNVQKTEEKTKEDPVTRKDPVITGEELSRAMAAELGIFSETESARRAFNTVASFWNVPPISEDSDFNPFNGMELSTLAKDLRVYRFSGNLGGLLRIDYPAVLELNMPAIPGKRFLSLVGMEDEQLLIDPPFPGKRSLSFTELEKHWSGHSFLLWKDPLNLLTDLLPGSKGDRIKRLQDLLREAGVYSRPSTGVYDSHTVSAVKEFQSLKGIEQDGIVGGQTLMLLYRSIGRFEVPGLTGGRE